MPGPRHSGGAFFRVPRRTGCTSVARRSSLRDLAGLGYAIQTDAGWLIQKLRGGVTPGDGSGLSADVVLVGVDVKERVPGPITPQSGFQRGREQTHRQSL